MSETLIFNCTYGKEEPERATLPFVAANIAATAGQDAVVLLTIEAVWLGTSGGTDGIAQPGLPLLDDLYQEFIVRRGRRWELEAAAEAWTRSRLLELGIEPPPAAVEAGDAYVARMRRWGAAISRANAGRPRAVSR